MDTYINALIGLLIGLMIYDMGFFKIIEGLPRAHHDPAVGTCPRISDAQINECNKIKDTVYKDDGDITNLQKRLKSLQNWQSEIVKTIKANTERNKANRDNIKRTSAVVTAGVKNKEKELNEVKGM